MRGNETMLIDNINYLRQYHRPIRDYLNTHEEDILKMPFQVIDTKMGQPTLQMEVENKAVFIHSKYDPIIEAERLVEKYRTELHNYQHIFFYGVGLGYVVDTFAKHFPEHSITIYEPSPAIFYHFLSNRSIFDLPLKKIKNIHLETSVQDRLNFLNHFANQLDENVLLVTLPSYERIFGEEQKEFLNHFKDNVSNKRSGLNTNLAYEKRWTINSFINFPEVLKTPNIFHDLDKEDFNGIPAVIVAAGPSLNEEIDHLRFIKENKLAYIFSVGSAINSLVEHDIYPDAAFTYDPSVKNQLVFEKTIQKGINTIPLIFGSSVGFETLQKYKGPKFHMITNQDTVSTYYLKHQKSNKLSIVFDAPSIAVITLQALAFLGCNPIILVGQNLGYKDNKTYAEGINFQHMSSSVSQRELDNAETTEATDGTEILTNSFFVKTRRQLEMYIKKFRNTTVINTTKGGAVIKGTEFRPLKDLIMTELKDKVVGDWAKFNNNDYDLDYLDKQQRIMEEQIGELESLLKEMKKQLLSIQNLVDNGVEKEMESKFNQFDKIFNRFKKNKYYNAFLEPMVRVEFEILTKKIQSIKFDKDQIAKGRTVVNTFAKFIYECQQSISAIYPLYLRLNNSISENKGKVLAGGKHD
jgi:hypothetical protein